MFKQRSKEKELMDDLTLSDVELIQNLHEIQSTNRWFGSRQTIISALDKIYKKIPSLQQQNVLLTDLGCGGGDLLRDAKDWARNKKVNIKLLGVDANPFITEHAKCLSKHYDISFETIDIYSESFKKLKFDIVMLNSFCHHFNDNDLSNLIKQLQKQTKHAIIVNDLHRHWLSYFGIKLLANILNFSSLGKHDGPQSVLRAFRKTELAKLMELASIENYQLKWSWAFRWQLIIWCQQSTREE